MANRGVTPELRSMSRQLPLLFHGMSLAVRLILAPAIALLASCSSAPSASMNSAGEAATLAAQADRWDKAIVAKDRAAIEANMAEDFRQIDGAGNIENKTSFVQGLLAPELKMDPYVVEELDVRLYGGVALLSGRTKMTGAYNGKPFTSHYRYIDVYVRRSEGWKVVSVQIAKLPQ
jgi:ketosteroid isomerase-like protein